MKIIFFNEIITFTELIIVDRLSLMFEFIEHAYVVHCFWLERSPEEFAVNKIVTILLIEKPYNLEYLD